MNCRGVGGVLEGMVEPTEYFIALSYAFVTKYHYGDTNR